MNSQIHLTNIFIASRLAVHVIKWTKTLPDPDHFKHSVVISVIIHGSSLALLSLLTYGLWAAIAVCGNAAHQFLYKLTQWPISSGIVLPAIQKFPITIGFFLVSMAYGSCGGLALICAVIMYLILLSKMYEDYLEEFVFKTAAVITEKLLGKKPGPTNAKNSMPDKKMTAPAPPPLPASAIKRPQENSTNQPNDNTNDKSGKTVEPTTSESEDKKEDEMEKVTVNEIIKEKNEHEAKKPVKKVEFDETVDEQQKHDKSQERSTSSESNEAESKTVLDTKNEDDAIVKSSSYESFEMLYNQLDPEDVAMFTQRDEPEEMTEEQRLELEKAEAGTYFSKIDTTIGLCFY